MWLGPPVTKHQYHHRFLPPMAVPLFDFLPLVLLLFLATLEEAASSSRAFRLFHADQRSLRSNGTTLTPFLSAA